jgi:hypothetical protein
MWLATASAPLTGRARGPILVDGRKTPMEPFPAMRAATTRPAREERG